MLEALRQEVCEANRDLVRHGLVVLTWGNVSGIDRKAGLVVIKPSGVAYDRLTPDDMVTVALATGEAVGSRLRPSSDLPAHLELYRAFPSIGGVTHTHSPYATSLAQARRPLPCFGTTHADHFHGAVPCTRMLVMSEVGQDYVACTGRLIVETFRILDPDAIPAVLVAGHGPFTWGPTPDESLRNMVALEACARLAIQTLAIDPTAAPLPAYLMDRHHRRKHGPAATYGQG